MENNNTIINLELEKYGIIPVIELINANSIEPLIKSLLEAGLPVVEITLRTEAGKKAIEIIKKRWPKIILGAGTLLNKDQIRFAVDYGADFGVSPGMNERVVEEALKLKFSFCPGIATPSDIERALNYGMKRLKFFPAEALGGLDMLKNLYAPYKHLGIKFNPTGGINPKNMEDYLRFEGVYAVGGTWIARGIDIENGNWEKIKSNIKEALSISKKIGRKIG